MLNTRLVKDILVKRSTLLLLLISLSVVVIIAVGLTIKSIPLFEYSNILQLLTGKIWSPMKGSFGFLPFIAGTLAVTLISLVIAIPLCILTAVYLTEYASDALKNMMLPLVNILAAIPPVLYGVWGVLFIVPLIQLYIAPVLVL